MNKRIKKKKRKQRKAFLNFANIATGIYEWSCKCSSSIAELSTEVQRFADCAGQIELYY